MENWAQLAFAGGAILCIGVSMATAVASDPEGAWSDFAFWLLGVAGSGVGALFIVLAVVSGLE